MKVLIHPQDSHGMNWVEGVHEWGSIKGLPEGVAVKVESRADSEGIHERYTFTNQTDRYLFTSRDTIGIYTPFNDSYERDDVCLYHRCHTHIFCGGNVSYVMALRMGGEAPHLGLTLAEGSLCGYSVERDLTQRSNDRGDFILHPSPMEMWAPGESFTIAWTLFWHEGTEDFYRQLPIRNPRHIDVKSEKYVLFEGETATVTVTPAFAFTAAEVTVACGGVPVPFTIRNGVITFAVTAQTPGECIYHIAVDGVATLCRLLVQPAFESLVHARCRFIAEHQQLRAPGTPLDGAYVVYDNEEEHPFLSSVNDLNSCRERVGMGTLLARYLQTHPDAALEASLRAYKAFLERSIIEVETGRVFEEYYLREPALRRYNYPWAATCYVEFYKLWEDPNDLLCAYRILKQYYAQNGHAFYGIVVPVVSLLEALASAGFAAEREDILQDFRRHGDRLLANDIHYPPSEVRFEQAIVAPAADLMCSLYKVTGDAKYLTGAARQMAMLELFNGRQPDWRLYEVAIRHWDGFWFGKRKCWGDTFPHHWSALTARCYEAYAHITKSEMDRSRAEAAYRGVLGTFFPDGRASCAYIFPITVNGQKGEFFDPYANDQDWALYFYLCHLGC